MVAGQHLLSDEKMLTWQRPLRQKLAGSAQAPGRTTQHSVAPSGPAGSDLRGQQVTGAGWDV